MKTKLNLTSVSLLFFLFSCYEPGEDQTLPVVQVTFKPSIQEKQAIQLTNARIEKQKAQVSYLNVYKKDGTHVIKDVDIIANFYYETRMELGDYTANLVIMDAEQEDKIEMEGSLDFHINASDAHEVMISVRSNKSQFKITLINLPGAKVWYGEKGFTPSNETLYDPNNNIIYPPSEMEIVIEWENEVRRYQFDVDIEYDYEIIINRNDEVKTSLVGYDYVVLKKSTKQITFEWE